MVVPPTVLPGGTGERHAGPAVSALCHTVGRHANIVPFNDVSTPAGKLTPLLVLPAITLRSGAVGPPTRVNAPVPARRSRLEPV